jgi:type II secretory pathway pseudopilin PulG
MNSRGQSLVQVLVGMVIMGILMVGFTSMMVNQQRETRALSEVLASMDLQRTLMISMSDGLVCKYVLNNPTVLKFNSNAVTPTTPQYISVNQLFSVPGPNAPVVAEVDKQASPYSHSLYVKSIKLKITSGTGSNFLGTWLVDFDATKSVRPVKPAQVTTTLTVDVSSPTAAKITACQDSCGGGGGGGGGGSCPDTQTYTTPGTVTWTKPSCGSSVKIECWGGGGGGSGSHSGGGGGGGGGGAYDSETIPASQMGATETVVIGAGGAGGPAANSGSNPGGNGGASSVGLHMTVAGGFGSPGSLRGLGGPGGSEPGGNGANKSVHSDHNPGASTLCSGAGGGGGQDNHNQTNGGVSACGGNGGRGGGGTGSPGAQPGGGGGGGGGHNAGGRGGAGKCIITTT